MGSLPVSITLTCPLICFFKELLLGNTCQNTEISPFTWICLKVKCTFLLSLAFRIKGANSCSLHAIIIPPQHAWDSWIQVFLILKILIILLINHHLFPLSLLSLPALPPPHFFCKLVGELRGYCILLFSWNTRGMFCFLVFVTTVDQRLWRFIYSNFIAQQLQCNFLFHSLKYWAECSGAGLKNKLQLLLWSINIFPFEMEDEGHKKWLCAPFFTSAVLEPLSFLSIALNH